MSRSVCRSWRWWLLIGCSAGVLGAGGCSRCQGQGAADKPGDASADAAIVVLTPEQRAQVIAKVGDRSITLGEYEAVLTRMDRFERLRYQSADRRIDLLNEMIDVELLAREAERRGLDKTPETRQRIQQALREEMLTQVRASVPDASAIPDKEVRAYYDEHRDEFFEPERRRAAQIVMADRAEALRVMEKARAASPEAWGGLVQRHSLQKPTQGADVPPELTGDLGIVSRPGESMGNAPDVPAAIRAAVFTIDQPGGIAKDLVIVDGRFHIVRLISKTSARHRTLEEAERSVRVSIVRRRVEEAEKRLEQELRKKYPVTVDDQALEELDVTLTEKQP